MREDVRSRPRSSKTAGKRTKITSMMGIGENEHRFPSSLEGNKKKQGSLFERQNRNKRTPTTVAPIVQQQRNPDNLSQRSSGFSAPVSGEDTKPKNAQFVLYRSASGFCNSVRKTRAIYPTRGTGQHLGDVLHNIEAQSILPTVPQPSRQPSKASMKLIQYTRQGLHLVKSTQKNKCLGCSERPQAQIYHNKQGYVNRNQRMLTHLRILLSPLTSTVQTVPILTRE